jgi:hypothetical protein
MDIGRRGGGGRRRGRGMVAAGAIISLCFFRVEGRDHTPRVQCEECGSGVGVDVARVVAHAKALDHVGLVQVRQVLSFSRSDLIQDERTRERERKREREREREREEQAGRLGDWEYVPQGQARVEDGSGGQGKMTERSWLATRELGFFGRTSSGSTMHS